MSNQTDNHRGPTQTETLLGGIDFIAHFDDGTSETIRIRQLKIKDCPSLMAAQGDELAIVELYCGKSSGWAEKLTTSSHEGILVGGDRLNADFFGRWLQRKLATNERLMPGALARIQEKAVQAALPASPNGSLKSPLSAA